MPTDPSNGIIAHAIQLAVAPVFLLTGIAGLLAVMANRLARIIDRARSVDQAWSGLGTHARVAARAELGNLERRRRVCSWSINYCAIAALLICLVIGTLFVEEFFTVNLKWLASALFVAAMLALIGGLTSIPRQAYLATHTINFHPSRLEDCQ